MNIYDAAHNLARALKNSKEYHEFIAKQKKAFNNPKAKEILDDFRGRAMEIQRAQMEGRTITEEQKVSMKKLEETMVSNHDIKEFFNAEMKFSQVMNDIYKIIGEAINTSNE